MARMKDYYKQEAPALMKILAMSVAQIPKLE